MRLLTAFKIWQGGGYPRAPALEAWNDPQPPQQQQIQQQQIQQQPPQQQQRGAAPAAQDEFAGGGPQPSYGEMPSPGAVCAPQPDSLSDCDSDTPFSLSLSVFRGTTSQTPRWSLPCSFAHLHLLR